MGGILNQDASADVETVLKERSQMLGIHEDGLHMLLANTVVGGCGGLDDLNNLTSSPTPAPSVCTQYLVTVNVTTDTFPFDTSWDLVNQCAGGGQGASRDLYVGSDRNYVDEYCLPVATYKFTIRDTFGDGLCCTRGAGRYEVFMNGVSQFTGGTFEYEDEHDFGTCEVPSDAPSDAPTQVPSPAPTRVPSFCSNYCESLDLCTDYCISDAQYCEKYCPEVFAGVEPS